MKKNVSALAHQLQGRLRRRRRYRKRVRRATLATDLSQTACERWQVSNSRACMVLRGQLPKLCGSAHPF